MTRPTVVLVSHTHWDREWYRPFEEFRARLVDTVDRVLDLLAADPDWTFVLDGQAIVVEDYLEVRPGRAHELGSACRSGRLAIGPWYVQPDSLLPSGEAHVRNLLEGRRVASEYGAPSTIAYTPDSFGHPAQFPQLFGGFGLTSFVYWRGTGAEVDELGPLYDWVAPDGTAILACLLERGYFAATGLRGPVDVDARRLAALVDELAGDGAGAVLLMNGFDHTLPDAGTAAVADALAAETGATVVRGRLEDYVDRVGQTGDRSRWSGDLLGARHTNLLPGVWSARLPLKLRNRAAEAALEGWAEPWAALGQALGGPDESASLRAAWRALLANQAHDSIGGCSIDAVHEQMAGRYDTADGLAEATTRRALERIAGLGEERRVPWSTDLDVAVFNPTPHARTDVVRLSLDAFPLFRISTEEFDVHPLTRVPADVGFEVDGRPARVVSAPEDRFSFDQDVRPVDVEFVAGEVPGLGWRRFRLGAAPPVPDVVDDGRDIEAGPVAVRAADDGTLTVRLGDFEWHGLGGLEDAGDRGDSYDFDPVAHDRPVLVREIGVLRYRHDSGVQHLVVERVLEVPVGLDVSRESRDTETVDLPVTVIARVAPGVQQVDLLVEIENTADDHRLRLLFPTGAPVDEFSVASTFDVARRSTTLPDDATWVHPAPETTPHQGWVEANGLTVVAPGLPEAEVTPDGVIAVTLVRAVGWLARMDLRSRPVPAGPAIPAPGAQCPGPVTARLALLPGLQPSAARATELGLRAVFAGPAEGVLAPDGASLLALEPDGLVLSALKPAEDGDGVIVRVLNPTSTPLNARLRVGVPIEGADAVRLDESPGDHAVEHADGVVTFPVPPHALRSVRLRPRRSP